MPRKTWTAQTEITDSLIRFREKKKWQLSYRRYVLEKMPSEAYAPYFGLDVEGFRQWIALQFTPELNWSNFATAWQLDHIVPVTYISKLGTDPHCPLDSYGLNKFFFWNI